MNEGAGASFLTGALQTGPREGLPFAAEKPTFEKTEFQKMEPIIAIAIIGS
jgi:hypothetical protein